MELPSKVFIQFEISKNSPIASVAAEADEMLLSVENIWPLFKSRQVFHLETRVLLQEAERFFSSASRRECLFVSKSVKKKKWAELIPGHEIQVLVLRIRGRDNGAFLMVKGGNFNF